MAINPFRIFRAEAEKNSPLTLEASANSAQFSAITTNEIVSAIVGIPSWSNPLASRISRAEAISVPAVKRVRDLVSDGAGSLPLQYLDKNNVLSRNSLFEQPEKYVPRSVTMSRLFEDLLFEGVAWWLVKERDYRGYPTFVHRLDPLTVNVNKEGRVYRTTDGNHGTSTEWFEDRDLIRFDSPNDGLLIAGGRAIRTCMNLDAAASRFADGVPPMDYITPADGVDPDSDVAITQALDALATAKKARATVYIPAGVKYAVNGFNPEQLQMAQAREHAITEIARLAGVDTEELGVSTTSRSYFNAQDREQHFVKYTLGPFLRAVEDRLSMGDVTPTGYVARFNLDDFLRADTLTRFQSYEVGLRVGAITEDEIRTEERRPALHGPQEGTAVTKTGFSADQIATTLDASPGTRFEVNEEARTITGLAVPYGKPAVSGGRSYQFEKGVLQYSDVSRVKLLISHDFAQAVGYATALDETDSGLIATFKVARGPEGDRALSLAQDKVLDGLSIGLGNGGQFEDREGVLHAVSAPLAEVSLTPMPAFDDARLISVAASADTTGVVMTNTNTVETAAAEKAPEFSATNMADAIKDGLKAGFEAMAAQSAKPAEVPAGIGFAQTSVKEAPLYRFDGQKGQRGFTEDIRSALFSGDSEARQRLEGFMGETFSNITTGNVAANTPNVQRPDLYVPQLQYSRPLWDSVTQGSIADNTPFVVPKFSSASNLANPHTEGTEPTDATYVTTSQTITPGAISGRAVINREIIDRGGNPQVDQIIFNDMLGAYFEQIETKIATALGAVATAEINFASAVDAALVNQFQSTLTGLQYQRGGNRYTGLVLDGSLFPALVNAADSTGRKLLPLIGATNAQGEASPGFDAVKIGNLTGRAAWPLGSGNSAKSYLFVPSSVYAWASAPTKFTFEYQVSSVTLGVWGYGASAVLRDSDVKPLDYTTADV